MKIAVQCQETASIKVRVEAEATLGEWREIIKRTNGLAGAYYAPLDDFLRGVKLAIQHVCEREEIKAEATDAAR
jgi:hypothetical protein